ncbi:diguanylate cyclase/phosphodiesterase (GGDEF & EAL domains) with PAS/PAC sensor(s) [hydrothermal vent metagenome]|uniref:Diguanylate cyclase/phosphodiesterase (GGDEF & EAL domains) with PAS/PAC sensor(S) n=1 Tax=hydrothermal vent metagenome TaxID=652676 RepID=A0A3B0U5P8_9ZZZZ
MHSNSNIGVILAIIIAFVPVLSVGYLLDNYYVREHEVETIQVPINNIARETQAAVYEAIDLMNRVVGASPSLCTASFVDVLGSQMQQARYVRQVIVENREGVQYCSALAGEVSYDSVSDQIYIPGRAETLSVVRIKGDKMPMLKITRTIDQNRQVSAFVVISPQLAEGELPAAIRDASMFRISLTQGTDLLVIGDPQIFDSVASDKYVIANAFAGDVPIRIEVAVSFAVLRAEYSEIYIGMVIFTSLVGAGILIMTLRFVQRSKAPSFDLEHAIATGAIVPYYQPVIDIATGRISGCEVLARWEKPNGEIISPAVFIEYAEVTGLAIPMTISIMERVKADLEQLSRTDPGLKISINLFEGHFRDGTIIDDVEAIFADSAISFRQLVFEITERHPLGNDQQAIRVINGFHALGCRLAMDDVGTGHSNLAYIQTLGVDIIKIDRVFIKSITSEETSAPVLDGLIKMAQELGAGIVAEGIETEAQALYLRARGVRDVQGFLFAPALPAAKYLDMVRALNHSQQVIASQHQDAA